MLMVALVEFYLAVLRAVLLEEINKFFKFPAREEHVDVIVPRDKALVTHSAEHCSAGAVILYVVLAAE